MLLNSMGSLIYSTPAVSDPYIANTGFLAGFNGANNATTYSEERTGAVGTFMGTAKLTTSSPKDGTASFLGSASQDLVKFPNSADYLFGSGDFTVEGFFNITTLPAASAALVCMYDVGTTQASWAVYIHNPSGSNIGLKYAGASTGSGAVAGASPSTITVATGTWYHWAVTREIVSTNEVIRFYVDGSYLGKITQTIVPLFAATCNLSIGCLLNSGVGYTPNFTFLGKQDEVRITKGVARYTAESSITVPSVPLLRTGPLNISHTTYATSGTNGSTYGGFTVTGRDGSGGYVYTLGGSWPTGITINSSTGVVGGTPSVDGSFSGLYVRVTDSLGSYVDTSTFTLVLAAPAVGQNITFGSVGSLSVLSNGNRDVTSPTGGNYYSTRSSIGKTSGKWYAEAQIILASSSSSAMPIGISNGSNNLDTYLGGSASSAGWLFNINDHRQNGLSFGTSPGSPTTVVNDIWMMAMDLDNGKYWIGKNGSWLGGGSPAAGTSPLFTFTVAGSTWYFGLATSSNDLKWRYPATLTYAAPSGFSVP